MDKKLVIVDGNSVMYREYYGIPLLKNSSGEPTNAIYGFVRHVIDIITKIKPTHIAIAFDYGKHTFRNDMFDGYKATRKPMPDDLRVQVAPLKNLLSVMGIKTVEMQGIEGDDVIGSLSKKFSVPTIIVTGDRDSFQLVDDTTVVYLNKKGLSDVKVMDEKAILETYGVSPSQMVHVKALQGDSSDNIPGVKGIGEKTALNLISKYGSVDGVYENIDSITGSTKEKLVLDKDMAYISLSLAKIKTDADLDVDLSDLEYKFPFNRDVKELFNYNGFRSLVSRSELFEQSGDDYKKVFTKKEVKEVQTEEELLSCFAGASEIGGILFGDYLHLSDGKTEIKITKDNVKITKVIMENPILSKIVFDIKGLKHSLTKQGVDVFGDVFDAMIAKHLISGASVTKISDLFGIEEDICQPASDLISIKGELEENLNRMGMVKLYREVEMPFAEVLFDMERVGFKIDEDRLIELDKKYEREINNLTREIYACVGFEFNINSPKQLGEIIYDKLCLAKSKKKSTASDVLETLADKHELIPLVIRYRKVSKFLSSFIKNMYGHMDKNGFIHTTLNQTLTTTGRLSSSEPNLQNIPIRGDESREIRSMFVASSIENVLIDADYSQIELRIMAHVTGDEKLIEAFKKGEDVHTQTAMHVFNVPKELVTPDMRRMAKVVNFGVNYGISDYGLASDLKISPKEAKNYITNFFDAHPKIKEFMDKATKDARETGRVSTLLGRTRRMDEINSANFQIRSRAERASYNMPIQGSASDIIKLAMIGTFNELKSKNMKTKLIMQVHDELILDAPKVEAEEARKIVISNMENAFKLLVPLEVDSVISYRWSEGH